MWKKAEDHEGDGGARGQSPEPYHAFAFEQGHTWSEMSWMLLQVLNSYGIR